MQIHFIAIGGAAMHSLAIALQQQGHRVTGSDDEIFDPAKTQLVRAGLLPEHYGWFPEKITSALDAVILGMHAHKDNPELQRAMELGIRVYSYPDFLYRETAGKTRVVIAGSHGKTTITAMVMHVLKYTGRPFDYMVGSRLEGFENMVSLSPDNPVAIFEGDEYLSSCLDPRPKFHLYQPQIALISGIAWDHINVFPTWEEYVDQFRIFIAGMPAGSSLVYCAEDHALAGLAETVNPLIRVQGYRTPEYEIRSGAACINHGGKSFQMEVFGRHNMQNMEGARLICRQLDITDDAFYEAIAHFKGAGKRLQTLGKKGNTIVFLDFAHSPSKVEATVNAAKEFYPTQTLVACLELHTYSSLNRNFLSHYRNTLSRADEALVFFNPETIQHKRLAMISPKEVADAFQKEGLQVFTAKAEVEAYLYSKNLENSVLLLMSSGNFDGINFMQLTTELLKKINVLNVGN